MIARKVAKRALGAVWQAMVDLAEGGNALVENAERAISLVALAQTAAMHARGLEDAKS